MHWLLPLIVLPSGLDAATHIENQIFDDAGTVLNMLQTKSTAPRASERHSSSLRASEHQGVSRGLEEGISVIVPGLGEYQRADLVQRNIAWIKAQNIPFDCTIFVYRADEEKFPLKKERFAPCKLVRHWGFWADHLRAFPLNQTRYKYVLHLLDSIQPADTLRLQRMIDIMKVNNLSHAAPTIPGYGRFTIMAKHQGVSPGRLVNYIELQMDMFTREYFACLQDVADDKNNMGWGLSEALPKLCPGALGLIDDMTMAKRYMFSYNYGEAKQKEIWFNKRLATKHPGFVPASHDDYTVGPLMSPEIWWMKDATNADGNSSETKSGKKHATGRSSKNRHKGKTHAAARK